MNMAEKTPVNWFEFKMRLDEAITQNDVTHVQAILEAVDVGEEYEQYKYSLCMKVLKSQQLELVKLLFPTELVFKDGNLNTHINRNLMNSAIQADFVDGIKYLHSQGLVFQLPDLKWSVLDKCVISNKLRSLRYLLSMLYLDLIPNPEKTLLMLASGMLHVKAIHFLLNTELRHTINQQCGTGKYTALHWCLLPLGGDHVKVMECVKLLVEAGADINIMANGESPVIMAARRRLMSVLAYLVNRGADIYIKNQEQDSILTYLERDYVFYYEEEVSEFMTCVETLVKAGLDINHRNNRHETPVYVAVTNNNHKLLTALLHFKFDMESLPGTGTPLLLAMRNRFDDIAEILILAGCDVNAVAEDGVTALMESVRQHKPGLVKLLLQYGADVHLHDSHDQVACDYIFQNINFYHATVTGSKYILEILKILIDVEADIYKCEHLLADAIKARCISVVKLLVDLDFQVDSTDNDGETESALALAVEFGEESLFDVLISKGCNVNKKNKAGETALYKAVTSSSESTCNDMVSTLTKHGADIMVTNSKGKTILMLAASNRRLLNIEALIPPGPYINQQDIDGKSALMFAVEANREDTIEILLRHKADPILKDKHSETALLMVVRNRSQPLKFYNPHEFLSLELFLKMQLDRGADMISGMMPLTVASQMDHHDGLLEMLLGADNSGVNLQDEEGKTALMLAVENNMTNIIKILLQNGSNPNICDNSGQTALILSTNNINTEVVEILFEARVDVNIVDKYGLSALNYAVVNHLSGKWLNKNGCLVWNYVNKRNLRKKWLNILKISLKNGCDVFLYNPRQYYKTLLKDLLSTRHSDVSWFLITENCSLQNLSPKHILNNLKYSDPVQLSKILYLCGASRTDTESVCLLSGRRNRNQMTNPGEAAELKQSNLEEFRKFCNTIDLKSRCRLVIRDSIGPGIRRKITQVGLPTVLQDFVLMKDWISEIYFDLTINDDDDDVLFVF